MSEKMYVALFDGLDETAQALDALREVGIEDDRMEVMSGVPFGEKMLGRPAVMTHVGKFALVGAVLGFLSSVALNFGTVALYPLRVGGFPLYAVAPTWVLAFELTMLGMLLSTFFGVLVELVFDMYSPKPYDPAISDGKIGIFFTCGEETFSKAKAAMQQLGASAVKAVEAKVL